MKRTIFLIAILAATNSMLIAQWSHIYTSPNQIYAIDAINEDTVFITGLHNLIRTMDGGSNWDTINHNLGNLFSRDIEFVNDSIGYIAGNNGFLAKTYDCGNTWLEISPSKNKEFTRIEFANLDTGWVISGYPAAIFRTTDGGNHWDSLIINDPNISRLLDIQTVNDSISYIVGHAILKTTNAGETWDIMSYSSTYASGCHFFNDSVGIFTLYYGIYRTENSGETYTLLYEDGLIAAMYKSEFCFVNSDTGYYVGYDHLFGDGLFYVTTNGGYDWTHLSNGDFYDIDMVNENVGYMIKFTGEIYKTTNGGLTSVEEEFRGNAEQISVYPNPFHGQISIEFNNTNINCGGIYIDVYNQYGCRDLSMSLSKKALNKINAETLGSGIYYYKIYTPNEIIQTGKIIKTR